jgi:hypothetical protein
MPLQCSCTHTHTHTHTPHKRNPHVEQHSMPTAHVLRPNSELGSPYDSCVGEGVGAGTYRPNPHNEQQPPAPQDTWYQRRALIPRYEVVPGTGRAGSPFYLHLPDVTPNVTAYIASRDAANALSLATAAAAAAATAGADTAALDAAVIAATAVAATKATNPLVAGIADYIAAINRAGTAQNDYNAAKAHAALATEEAFNAAITAATAAAAAFADDALTAEADTAGDAAAISSATASAAATAVAAAKTLKEESAEHLLKKADLAGQGAEYLAFWTTFCPCPTFLLPQVWRAMQCIIAPPLWAATQVPGQFGEASGFMSRILISRNAYDQGGYGSFLSEANPASSVRSYLAVCMLAAANAAGDALFKDARRKWDSPLERFLTGGEALHRPLVHAARLGASPPAVASPVWEETCLIWSKESVVCELDEDGNIVNGPPKGTCTIDKKSGYLYSILATNSKSTAPKKMKIRVSSHRLVVWLLFGVPRAMRNNTKACIDIATQRVVAAHLCHNCNCLNGEHIVMARIRDNIPATDAPHSAEQARTKGTELAQAKLTQAREGEDF